MAKTKELDMSRFSNFGIHELSEQDGKVKIQVGITITLSPAAAATVSFQDEYDDEEARGALRQRLARRALQILAADVAAL
ncbi:hypothetical protein SAMN05216456_1892 [Devosia crocina]|uniref:Uncharacterized protein n=1 Tax=Devosia crocina TaxID=429728 RepID=A0A1I7NEN4_9HYPH|nr:hypothetical protein [Devosia crocina]SFV33121.1 hypothetical protein SAMN05216456_1892 [Devosia crocina]